MAQQLKDEIDESIRRAALRVFAERGYASATMAQIAKVAGVSTGNIYLYFPSKQQLFQAVLPDEFVAELMRRMSRKVKALEGVRDIDILGPTSPYRVLSEEHVQFWITHRERVVVLLTGARGTAHEAFPEQAVERLVRLAIGYLATIRPHARVSRSTRAVLSQIYRNFLSAIASVLASYDDEEQIREMTEQLSMYHLAGIRHLFEVMTAERVSIQKKLA